MPSSGQSGVRVRPWYPKDVQRTSSILWSSFSFSTLVRVYSSIHDNVSKRDVNPSQCLKYQRVVTVGSFCRCVLKEWPALSKCCLRLFYCLEPIQERPLCTLEHVGYATGVDCHRESLKRVINCSAVLQRAASVISVAVGLHVKNTPLRAPTTCRGSGTDHA